MPAPVFQTFSSRYAVLPSENIDTDQIIPARFLTTTERTGLGRHAFYDWRFAADGTPNPEFPLNTVAATGARILVTGRNFGCGSSREHAVWALLGIGFDVVVSEQFADIFRANALGNGLLPVQVDAAVISRLMQWATVGQSPAVEVDLVAQHIVLPGGESVRFPIAPFARHRMLHGIDEMDFLLDAQDDIRVYESKQRASLPTHFAGPGR